MQTFYPKFTSAELIFEWLFVPRYLLPWQEPHGGQTMSSWQREQKQVTMQKRWKGCETRCACEETMCMQSKRVSHSFSWVLAFPWLCLDKTCLSYILWHHKWIWYCRTFSSRFPKSAKKVEVKRKWSVLFADKKEQKSQPLGLCFTAGTSDKTTSMHHYLADSINSIVASEIVSFLSWQCKTTFCSNHKKLNVEHHFVMPTSKNPCIFKARVDCW